MTRSGSKLVLAMGCLFWGCGDPLPCPPMNATYPGTLEGELNGQPFQALLTIVVTPEKLGGTADCSGTWEEDKKHDALQGRFSACAVSCEAGNLEHTKLNLTAGPPLDGWSHYWDPEIGDVTGTFRGDGGAGTWAVNPDYTDAQTLRIEGSGSWSVAW